MKQIKTRNLFVQGVWSILNILKNKLVMMEILVFPKWMVEFHVHANVSIIIWRGIHAQPRETILFHKVYFNRNTLTRSKWNYASTKVEGLAMVYMLHMFEHFLLGGYLKFFIDHWTMKLMKLCWEVTSKYGDSYFRNLTMRLTISIYNIIYKHK